jgi:hypothetical protein
VARPRKRRRFDVETVEAILAGEVLVDLGQLFELVRRVNPTGLRRSADEREMRYALKARLQSRILRDFSDDVVVLPTKRTGIVSIRRCGTRREACHALVSRLDSNARPPRD